MARFDKLLVLDLDETLIHARETPPEHPPSWEAAGYVVYERPLPTSARSRSAAGARGSARERNRALHARELLRAAVQRLESAT